MSTLAAISAGELADLAELAPLVRRASSLDAASVVRLRVQPTAASALVRLPFGVLVGRRIAGRFGSAHDGVYGTTSLLQWLDGQGELPPGQDAAWRTGLPPETGWRRVELVPDDAVRAVVRQGALTLKEAAGREGVPGASPRAEVVDVLLDSIVLIASDEAANGEAASGSGSAGSTVEVNLRLLSALVRMGFLARGSHLSIDVAGRWLRLAASFGSAYAERPGFGLGLGVRTGSAGTGVTNAAAQPHGGVGRQQASVHRP